MNDVSRVVRFDSIDFLKDGLSIKENTPLPGHSRECPD